MLVQNAFASKITRRKAPLESNLELKQNTSSIVVAHTLFFFQQQNMCHVMASQQNSFLYTVSRLVSSRDIRRRGSEEEGGRLFHVTDPDPTVKPKHFPKPPILETLFYIHLITFFAILTMSWVDTLPGIGRVGL